MAKLCPSCGFENNDQAKFCKKCGTAMNNDLSSDKSVSPEDSALKKEEAVVLENKKNSGSGTQNNKNLIIGIAIAICFIVLGAFVLLNEGPYESQVVGPSDRTTEVTSDDSSGYMKILGGTITTEDDYDKTHCTVWVDEQYSGETVKISVLYSWDGNDINQGKKISKKVDENGAITVTTAEVLEYYPDYAVITIWDTDGYELDERRVSLETHSGTQYF